MSQQESRHDKHSDIPDDLANQEKSGLLSVLLSPLAKSLALHVCILAALLISFNFSSEPLKFIEQPSQSLGAQPEIVKATFVDSNVIEQRKREKAQAEADAQRKQQAAEKRRQDELRKKRVAEEAKKKEQARKEEIARQERERLNKLELEQQKEKEIAKRLEQEAKEEAKRQEEFEKMLQEQLEAEQEALNQSNQRRIMSEVEKYKALVYSKVKRNLETDGGFIGKSCKINVRLANDGLVLQARAIEGDNALCRLAQSAVLKAGTLPVSKDPDVMAKFKNFDIEVRPEK